MKTIRSFALLLCVYGLCAGLSRAEALANTRPLRFSITMSASASDKPVEGRLLVFMSNSSQPQDRLEIGFIPGSTWVAAQEVESISPGQTIYFDPDIKAYPQPFSQAKAGTYQFMALLDTDHSYPYTEQAEGDLYSAVIKVDNLDPTNTPPVELAITKRTESRVHRYPDAAPKDTANVKLVEFQSAVLSRFWGRPIFMQAGVVLPPSYDKSPDRRYPSVYSIHGFGGDHTAAWQAGPRMVADMASGKSPEMIVVFLNGHCPTGHHEFADSVNNGPWGQALTQEFIPYLEGKFRMVGKPYARFLTGHSSGGWSSLWLQVTYPDFFGGTWSTSPDPVDLRSFTGIDVTPGSTDNAYRTRDGKQRNLVREHTRELASLEQFAKEEEVLGEYGGQFASFEWVWSPKGQDGRPMKLFNRETGELNPEVEKAWTKYDIRRILDENWATLGPKLKGKLNVICGGDDTFHLEEAAKMLCAFLKEKGSDAVCEIIPGRTHMDLYRPYESYPEGLSLRIAKEMDAKFKAH